ncbi:MAG: NADH-quinone oxidoreductase subunit F [Deltaproteobacteria bacterium HGW-Deltaproteobacteria-14]|jgi:NADH-quinone oxidoreductase subunit F|nr:MAG: NADH-quinone oxidoreductase subunit F [Deltaproteobacteria bacterium HGW-Deltaproteobacteria-14]
MPVQTYNYLLRDKDGKDYRDLAVYKAAGGYKAVLKAHAMGSEAIIAEVKTASIRGRGGAGFPAGVKWGFVPKDTNKPKYLVVNADEGEPGTFKDNYYLSQDPHRLLEGCIITAFALDIHTVYIYVRGEFIHQIATLDKAIADCHKAGILGKDVLGTKFALEIHTHSGAGAYICGEETALLESLEGKPGQPRLKPPFPAVVGAFGCPTVINNVETIASVPLAIEHGGAWFAGLGVERDGGTRIVGVSGHVKRPGLFEVGVGANMKDVIYELAGGILEDRPLKAVIPGGSSCPVMTPDEINVPMTIDAIRDAGSMLGTCGIIVMAEGTCMVRALARLSHFYAHESCGQCTPCREGTGWMARIIDDIEAGRARQGDLDTLVEIADQIGGNTICALGDAASLPVQSFLQKFRADFQAHIDHGGCPFDGPLPRWTRP